MPSRVAILTPVAPTGHVYVGTAQFVAQAVAHGALWITSTGPYIQVNRTSLVRAAQEADRPYLLWLDSDVVPPTDCIERLLAHRRDVVAGAYPMCCAANGHAKFFWLAQHIHESDCYSFGGLPAKLFEANTVGTGCLLMATRVFDELPQPWFDVPMDPDGPAVEPEDVRLCRILRKAGIPIWCDGSVRCDHHKPASLASIFQAAREEHILTLPQRR